MSTAEGRRKAFQLWQKLTKPLATPLLISLALQGIVAMALTSAEQNSLVVMSEKLKRVEERMNNERTVEEQPDF